MPAAQPGFGKPNCLLNWRHQLILFIFNLIKLTKLK